MAQLKELVARKDAEIERFQLPKDQRPRPPEIITERRSTISPKATSPLSPIIGGSANQSRRSSTGKVSRSSPSLSDAAEGHRKVVSDLNHYSEHSIGDMEGSSQQHYDDIKHQKDYSSASRQCGMVSSQNTRTADVELLGFGDGDSEERLSDISDGGLSMGTETDGSSSIVELTLFPEAAKSSNATEKK